MLRRRYCGKFGSEFETRRSNGPRSSAERKVLRFRESSLGKVLGSQSRDQRTCQTRQSSEERKVLRVRESSLGKVLGSQDRDQGTCQTMQGAAAVVDAVITHIPQLQEC